jgi:alkylation response protein AidB-like acyl-CoA dehydrogenase
MTARRHGADLVVSGRKKPCSLTWSMDLLSASVAVSDPDGGPDRLAVVLVPAASPGIERRPFWASPILAGAESDELVLTDVVIPEQLAFYPQDGQSMDPLQARGFAWFELLVTASYVGAASGLVERVLTAGRGTADERVSLVAELETVMAALDSAATALAAHGGDPVAVDGDLARVLMVRYSAERTLERVAMGASALVGGMGFIGSGDAAYLLAACRPLAYHPPSRAAAAEPLARHLAGGALVL